MNRLDPQRQLLGMAIAALAGYVDAVGYLSADGYFVSFMSGNTTRMGVDFVSSGARALIPAMLIAGFVGGVTTGSVLAARTGRWRKPVILLSVSVLLALGTLIALAGPHGLALLALVVAMGMLNTTLRREQDPIGLTYMTGALVRIGQGLAARLSGQDRVDWLPFLRLWLTLAAGAALGAFTYLRAGSLCLIAGSIWAILAALFASRFVRRA
ncbi:DUF1275 family protein [Novosphingobium sp. PC22D]|uniref:YoaK family protein n=1 Tax=Novosphingobium sp. PC22D TaxID=1962403 RepID=UPI000BF11827|nr:DUF1275 family protein [Novosphingobium sp. PC22D]PEQ12106.1 DUF1275 family protein [Novosphingobium sp. PC22D]